VLPWFKRLFASPPPVEPKPDAGRVLFHYWDGEKQRSIDPLLANRKIFAHAECDIIADGKIAQAPTKPDGTDVYPLAMVTEAEDKILGMTRDVFDVKPWSESTPGLTMDETNQLLADFFAFRNELKKKLKTSPMQSPASTSPEPAPSSDSTPKPSPESMPPESGSIASELNGVALGGSSRPSEAA
jgi:hypothetical protein